MTDQPSDAEIEAAARAVAKILAVDPRTVETCAIAALSAAAKVRGQPAPEDGITIRLSRRPDGGLRVCSDDVRGLILSGADPAKVMSDIWPALEVLRPLPPPPAGKETT